MSRIKTFPGLSVFYLLKTKYFLPLSVIRTPHELGAPRENNTEQLKY